MACTKEFVAYAAGQAAGAGEIAVRPMMGEYLLYCDGKLAALLCDNQFFLKPTRAGRALLRQTRELPPYPGAKPCFLVEELDDPAYLAALLRASWAELPFPAPRKPRNKKTKD